MSLFKRTPKGDPADRQRAALGGFWSWWAARGRTLASGSTTGEVSYDELALAITGALDPIDPALVWEVARGTSSRLLLVVTAAGAPERRAIARRWRLSAPPPDEEWAYTDIRPPYAGDLDEATLRIGDRSYVVGEATVAAHVRGVEIDVAVHHPQFAEPGGESPDFVTLLLLEQVLGQEAMDTWIGLISSSPVPALDPVPIGGLRSVVAGLRADHTEPDGSPKFALLQGVAPGGLPVLVLARIPLRPATAPHLDTYVGVALPYSDQTPEGLPGPESLDRLRALEDHVTERLGGSGEVVAVQSHEGIRVLHIYVDGTTPAAEQIRVAVQGWDQGDVQIEARHDPAWSAVQHLRG